MKIESIKKAGIEVLSIVFAVLLALGLTHWREDVNAQKASDRALTNIIIEIHSNILELEQEKKAQEEQLKSVLILQKQVESGEEQTQSLGFSMPVLSNSAWTVANATGAVENFDLQLLMDLSGLYRTQKLFQDHGLDYFKLISTIEFNKEENFLAVVKSNAMQSSTTLSLARQLNEVYIDFYADHGNVIRPFLPDSLKTRYAVEPK